MHACPELPRLLFSLLSATAPALSANACTTSPANGTDPLANEETVVSAASLEARHATKMAKKKIALLASVYRPNSHAELIAGRMLETETLDGQGRVLPLELVSVDEAHELFPPMDPSGVRGAVYLPTDGHLDPTNLALALARGAKSRGAEIAERVRVMDLVVRRGRIHQVVTDHGTVEADVVVNAGGMWAHELGTLAGITVPVVPMSHQYAITRLAEQVPGHLPTLRDPDNLVYFREEVGGLVVGGYERNPAVWSVDGIPADFNHKLLTPDMPRFEPLMKGAIKRIPDLDDAEVVRFINGPEGFTPDNEFVLGESDVRGLFVAAGFCAHGIAGAGGIGKVVAEWIAGGEPSMDLWRMDIRRFGPHYRSREHTVERTTEVYATYYDIHYPHEERRAGRPLRLSPSYGRLEQLGAEFGEKSGWERANWFRSNEDETLEDLRPRGWAGRHWSTAIPAEHTAVRERAGLFDETSFAKIEVGGPGAVGLLQRLCANDVDKAPGTVTYTQMLNTRGGIECDFTVTRLADDRFLIVTGTAFGQHDRSWITRHMPDDGSVQVRDVTSSLTCIGLWGPRARDILSAVSDDDLSFGYMRAREITVRNVPCLALRVTYVGELGWELYAPMELGARLWDVLVAAGRDHGAVPAGYRAIDSLRLEKGYRVWGADITPDENPFEAGLGFAVKLDKEVDFVGRDALLVAKEAGITRRLSCLTLGDLRAVALGNEPVRANDEIVSRVTTGGQGFTLPASIAYAYLPVDLAKPGTEVEVEVFGEWIPATVAREPLWDPDGERIRA
jgi:glycine cleavage system T protein